MRERIISCIYKIQSKCKPERIYIGSAVHFYRRRREHLYDLRRGVYNPKLLNHYRKYGEDDLVFSIVAECSREELKPIDNVIWIEQVFIWVYRCAGDDKPWFNAIPNAGSCFGRIHSEETKRKIGAKSKVYNTGRKHSEESKRKIGEGNKNKIISASTIEKLKPTLFKKGQVPWNFGLGGTYTISKKEKKPNSISRAEYLLRKEELRLLDIYIEKMEEQRKNKVA